MIDRVAVVDANGNEIFPGCYVHIFDGDDYDEFHCDRWFLENNNGIYEVSEEWFGIYHYGICTVKLVGGVLPGETYHYYFPCTCMEVINIYDEDIPELDIGGLLL